MGFPGRFIAASGMVAVSLVPLPVGPRVNAAPPSLPSALGSFLAEEAHATASDLEALLAGKLTLGRLEIARLDNDRNFPERGVFILERG